MPHLRFGDCEIHLTRRELRRQGVRQDLPPKAYALLLLLIEHRDRVVGKQELLQRVWGRDALSPSVLGRTVMLVRRAIGDVAGTPRWIQSLHGVGYRFIGEASGDAAHAAAPPLPAAGVLRVAVLPCENATGEDAHAWTDVGLVALVARALADDPRVHVLPPAEVLRRVARDDGGTLPAEWAWQAMEPLGLAAVVHARLTRQGAALWLEYRVFRRGGDLLAGSLRGEDLVSLADRLAAGLVQGLNLPPGEGRRSLADPFIAQAWARAVELHGQGDYTAARPLLEVVHQHAPSDADALLLHLDCLARLREPDAAARAQRVLAQARAAGDARLHARVLATLALTPDGEDHRAAALAQAAPFQEEDWAQELHLDAASRARTRGDLAEARRLLAALSQLQGRRGCTALRARIDFEQAALDHVGGELADARERLESVVAFERRLHRRAAMARALSLLACVKMAQGLLDRAVEHVDEVLALARDVSVPADALARLMVVCRERLDSLRIRQLLALPSPACGVSATAARACLALADGDLKAARQRLHDAVMQALAGRHLPLLYSWLPAWLRVEAAFGTPAAACAVEQAGPFGQHPVLQAALWHARAAAAWRAGGLADARAALQQMAAVLPAGREQACAQMDLAWCALELGEPAEATRLLGGLGPWLREHPLGLAVHARHLHALGCHAEAAVAQQAAMDRHGGAVPPLQRALLAHYRRCAAGEAPAARPWPPSLPSDAWLPPLTPELLVV